MDLFRVPISGGIPELLFPVDGLTQYCAPTKVPTFVSWGGRIQTKNELAISSFDPLSANQKDLLRVPLDPGTNAGVGLDYAWQISPDGSWIGIAKRHEIRIRLMPWERIMPGPLP